MIRRLLATLFLALLVASPALAQTGQINGVITDNTGGVVPGATREGRRSGHRLVERHGHRRRWPLYLHVAAAHHLRHQHRDFRVPPVAAERRAAAGEPEPHGELRDRARHARRNGHRLGRIAHRRRVFVDHQRSRRFETHRRTAVERPRCRHAEHAGAGDGAHRGRSRIGQNDPGRAAHVDQWDRIAAGLVPVGRHQPLRSVLPAESAVPVPRCAAGIQHSDQQLQRRPGEQRRRGRQRGDAVWHQRVPRRRVRLPARSQVRRQELLLAREGLPEAQAVRRLWRRSDRAQQDVLLRRLAGHDDLEPGVATGAVCADDRPAQRQLRHVRRGVQPRAHRSADRPAVPRQSDSGDPLRSGVGQRPAIHAAGRR